MGTKKQLKSSWISLLASTVEPQTLPNAETASAGSLRTASRTAYAGRWSGYLSSYKDRDATTLERRLMERA